MAHFKHKFMLALLLLFCTFKAVFTVAFAENTYTIGKLQEKKLDSGYSINYSSGKDYSHISMGTFKVTALADFTSNGKRYFLIRKNSAILTYERTQSLDAINDNENLYVSEDTNHSNKQFNFEEQNRKKGFIYVQKANYPSGSKSVAYKKSSV